MADELLTIHELAAALRISRASVYQLRYLGQGPPAIKLGGRLRWRRADVDAWIAQHLEGGGEAKPRCRV